MNIYERPEGIKISSFFIVTIIGVSLLSRALRSTELRITEIELSQEARDLLREDEDHVIRVMAHTPRPNLEAETAEELDAVDRFVRDRYGLTPNKSIYFVEVIRTDVSEFQHTLWVDGRRVGRNKVLYAKSPVVANSIAALLIELERRTGNIPHGYFKWKEGNPVFNMIRLIFLGEGDTAPVTHEVLRRAVPDIRHRPIVHVS